MKKLVKLAKESQEKPVKGEKRRVPFADKLTKKPKPKKLPKR